MMRELPGNDRDPLAVIVLAVMLAVVVGLTAWLAWLLAGLL
jgi:hypothetical protein